MKLKRISKALVLALALSMTTPSIGNVAQVATVQAATKVQLSATKKTIKTGQSFTLKVKGTSKKVSWSSSKKTVAAVTSAGKVTGKGVGTAVITAKVSSKKYTCKVTVKKANKYLKGAPFDAKETTLGKYSAVIPSKWEMTKDSVGNTDVYAFMPEGNETGSNIMVSNTYTKAENKNFDDYAELLKTQANKEFMEKTLTAQTGVEVTISDFNFTTSKCNAGKVTKISYTAKAGNGMTIKQTIYDLFANGYTTEVTITDAGEGTTPDLYEVADYLLNSLVFNK